MSFIQLQRSKYVKKIYLHVTAKFNLKSINTNNNSYVCTSNNAVSKHTHCLSFCFWPESSCVGC